MMIWGTDRLRTTSGIDKAFQDKTKRIGSEKSALRSANAWATQRSHTVKRKEVRPGFQPACNSLKCGLAEPAARPAGKIDLQMGVGEPQVGGGNARPAPARDHVADDMIGLDHGAFLEIVQHGSG